MTALSETEYATMQLDKTANSSLSTNSESSSDSGSLIAYVAEEQYKLLKMEGGTHLEVSKTPNPLEDCVNRPKFDCLPTTIMCKILSYIPARRAQGEVK